MTCRDIERRAGVKHSEFRIEDVSGALSYNFITRIDLGKTNTPFMLETVIGTSPDPQHKIRSIERGTHSGNLRSICWVAGVLWNRFRSRAACSHMLVYKAFLCAHRSSQSL